METKNVYLNQSYLKYVFSDNSGIIFYNEVSGETIALDLTINTFETFLLSGELQPDWDRDFVEQLQKVVDFHIPPSLQLENDFAE